MHDETESHLRPERPALHLGLLLRVKLNETALVCGMSNVRKWMENLIGAMDPFVGKLKHGVAFVCVCVCVCVRVCVCVVWQFL